jgi:hypothetical protein
MSTQILDINLRVSAKQLSGGDKQHRVDRLIGGALKIFPLKITQGIQSGLNFLKKKTLTILPGLRNHLGPIHTQWVQ